MTYGFLQHYYSLLLNFVFDKNLLLFNQDFNKPSAKRLQFLKLARVAKTTNFFVYEKQMLLRQYFF